MSFDRGLTETKTRFYSEQGIFLAITAFIALGLILFYLAFAFNRPHVNHVTASLQKDLDHLCERLSIYSDKHRKAYEIFTEEVFRLENSSLELISAELIMPTMTEKIDSPTFYQDDVCFNPGGVNPVPPLMDPIDSRVRFRYDLCKDGKADPAFPRSMWTNEKAAGSIVGCKVMMRYLPVEKKLLGISSVEEDKLELKAASVWRKELIAAPVFIGNDTAGMAWSSSSRLTIVVAPHLSTFSSFLSADPHRQFNFASIPALKDSYYNVPSILSSASAVFNRGVTAPPVPPSWPNQLEMVAIDPNDLQAINIRIAAYRACMNPVILVRNIFLSYLAERAMRYGPLRRTTDIYLANTHHRDSSYGTISQWRNPPVEIVSFGSDLAASRYHLPYTFFAAPQNDTLDPFNNTFNLQSANNPKGLTDPTVSQVGLAEGEDVCQVGTYDCVRRRYARVLAEQLRLCYHLYTGVTTQNVPEQGLPLYELPNLHWISDDAHEKNNKAFEPASFAFNPGPVNLDGNDAVASWRRYDQRGSWNGFGASNDTLTAPQLLSMLGSVQVCPFPFRMYQGGPFCQKPDSDASLNNDLRPDLLAAIQYLIKSVEESGVEQDGHAFRSPGFFPVDYSKFSASLPNITERPFFEAAGLTPALRPYHDDFYAGRPVIVVVLHNPLTETEAESIRNILTNDNLYDLARIVVVYMPAFRGYAMREENESRLRYAFNIDSTKTYDPRFNTLLWFGLDKDSDGGISRLCPSAIVSSGVSELDAEIALAGLWNCLLEDNAEKLTLIVDNLFDQYITKRELLF